jgi:hypothetical protein
MITKDLIPEVGTKSFVIMNCLLKGLCPGVTSASAGSCDSHSRAPSGPIALSRAFTAWIARVKARDNRVVNAVTHDTSGRDGNLQVILRHVPATSTRLPGPVRTAPARTAAPHTTGTTDTACSRTRCSLRESRTHAATRRLEPTGRAARNVTSFGAPRIGGDTFLGDFKTGGSRHNPSRSRGMLLHKNQLFRSSKG